jgi:hypothetical protein
MTQLTWIRRFAIRIVTDEYLDLYILGGTALVFTVLGVLGISGIKVLSSVILALLAVLSFSQIRSRRQVAEIVDTKRWDPFSLFREDFPENLPVLRTNATTLLLIGVSLARTIQSASRTELRQMLVSGGRVRVLVVNPEDDKLVQAASIQRNVTADRMRRRIQNALDELTELRDNTNGHIEIRLMPFVPHMGINLIDKGTPRGLITVQHYEHRPTGEDSPIFLIMAKDGVWYEHFVAEAERMWHDGIPWPLAANPSLP